MRSTTPSIHDALYDGRSVYALYHGQTHKVTGARPGRIWRWRTRVRLERGAWVTPASVAIEEWTRERRAAAHPDRVTIYRDDGTRVRARMHTWPVRLWQWARGDR